MESDQSLFKPRLGFLGLDRKGQCRLQAIARSGLGEICAIADPNSGSDATATGVVAGAELVRNLDELLGLGLDGIVMATPGGLNGEQAIEALKAGCAVFCQNPPARTGTETNAVIQAARQAGRLLGLDSLYRHTKGVQAIHRLIREGQLGEIYAVELVFHNAYSPGKAGYDDAGLSGGGCLRELGTHLLDLALWCLDSPGIENVNGHVLARGTLSDGRSRWNGSGDPREADDYAAVQIQLVRGAAIQVACSWKAALGCNARIGATFLGTRGGASFRNVEGSFHDFMAEQFLFDRSRRLLAAPPDDWGGRAILNWTRRLASSPSFDPGVEVATRVASAIDAIYRVNGIRPVAAPESRRVDQNSRQSEENESSLGRQIAFRQSAG